MHHNRDFETPTVAQASVHHTFYEIGNPALTGIFNPQVEPIKTISQSNYLHIITNTQGVVKHYFTF
jgi:hypothetical protein